MSPWMKCCAVALALACCTLSDTVHAQSGDMRPFTWTGIDVVTNDFGITAQVRALTGITPGESISMNSPRLAAACASVRAAFPRAKVVCTAIAMAGHKALYVVQLSSGQLAGGEPGAGPHPVCAAAVPSARFKRLVALVEQDSRAIADRPEIPQYGEFVNNQGFLDAGPAAVHRQRVRYFQLASRLHGEIEQAARSCDPALKADGIHLLNYAGQPARAVSLALAAMNDDDARVRNVALRLLSSFHKWISPTQVAQVVASACAALHVENFFDRNKALMVLSGLLGSGAVSTGTITPPCRMQIALIAVHSDSAQIGIPAKALAARLSQSNGPSPPG